MITKHQQDIARLAAREFDWPIPWDAVKIIADSEGCRLKAYLCPASVWTIGWGETDGVEPGMKWDEKQADDALFADIKRRTDQVRAMVTGYANDNQLGALVSLAYNIGLGYKGDKKKRGLLHSRVLALHNENDFEGASRAFSLINTALVNGKRVVLPGLTTRRAAEAAIYLRPDPEDPPQPMPQAVEPESKLSKSPINAAGVTTVGAGAATLLSQTSDVAAPVVEKAAAFATALNINPLMVLGALLLAAGGAAVYWRFKQREEGWV